MKLLIVEDEKDLLSTLSRGLALDGYAVDQAPDGETATAFLDVFSYDLIILDINLPGMSGFDVLSYAMKKDSDSKILMLTAYSDVGSKVRGLDLGASDYMVKPFEFAELEARIRMLLRRSFVQHDTKLSCGDLEFDTLNRSLSIKGTPVSLTKKETQILEYLLRSRGRPVSSDELMSHAWESDAEATGSSVRVHMTTLRRKIKDVLGWNPVRNRIGEGYFITDEQEEN